MKKNRLLAFLLSIVCVFSFASCQAFGLISQSLPDNETESSSNSSSSSSSEEEKEEEEEGEEEEEEENILQEGVMPEGTVYALNDRMYDFTATTLEGNAFTLSEVLKEKKLVMLNFWATWCSPCVAEFPLINTVYKSYKEDVAILALSVGDTASEAATFKSENELAFDVGVDLNSLADNFGVKYIPTTVLIDRYGKVVFLESDRFTSVEQIANLFEAHLDEVNYLPFSIKVNSDSINTNLHVNEEVDFKGIVVTAEYLFKNEEHVDFEELKFYFNDQDITNDLGKITETAGVKQVKVLYKDLETNFEVKVNPSANDVGKALTADNSFTFTQGEGESWPWLVSEEQDYIYASVATENAHGGYSALSATFKAGPGDAIFFDYMVNTDANCDILYVLIDDVPVQQLSGVNDSLTWVNDFGAYVFREYEAEGTHKISFVYRKDAFDSVDGEAVWLKNLRIEQSADNVNSNIFRYAANVLNEDENPTAMYKHYADVVLSDVDGYYHVGAADGPILFASILISSPWSEQNLWELAESDYIVVNNVNYKDEIFEYAWAANQPIPGFEALYGYAPVTQDLKQLLDFATQSQAVREEGFKNWTGAWHENEWLELCVYYETYGDAEPIEDPMKTITFHAAEQVFEGRNTANVLFNMTPRGFKYKFIPEKSGFYNIYSVGDRDTVCFFFGEDTETYDYYDNGFGTADKNFNFYVYLEEGKTYYLALTTYLDEVGRYEFNIDYEGETYSYMKNCATMWGYDEEENKVTVYDGVEYGYSEGTDTYHVLNADGSLGDVIYVDMLHPTCYFPDKSLFDIATYRTFYIDGVDYTQMIYDYAEESLSNDGDFKGYVALNQELFDVLTALSMRDYYTYDGWQLMCYHYVTIG